MRTFVPTRRRLDSSAGVGALAGLVVLTVLADLRADEPLQTKRDPCPVGTLVMIDTRCPAEAGSLRLTFAANNFNTSGSLEAALTVTLAGFRQVF